VAGIASPRVDTPEGRAFVSTVVAFDSTNDLAVLRVPELGTAALALAPPDRSTPIALVGYPENGPLTRTPGRLGGTANVLSRDAYGDGPVRRQMSTIRGAVQPGSSGGPGVDAQGRVRTTVFARRPRETGGYGIPADLVQRVLAQAGKPVATTSCTD
jgi:S1-C subfamily serine protease